jgi:predicted enzyme related to lactoylglutathione lyase
VFRGWCSIPGAGRPAEPDHGETDEGDEMTDVTTRYPPGTPAWVDLITPDVRAALAFYQQVLGWEFSTLGGELADYHVALVHDRAAAGLMPRPAEDDPAAWTTYLATDDLDATVAAAEKAGGELAAPVFDVPTQGRGAVLIDPTGAVVGFWQADGHLGAGVVNEPGAVCWNELATRDAATAAAFYQQAAGVDVVDAGFGFDYRLLNVHGHTVGGLYDASTVLPAGAPPAWLVYFQVTDTDATLERVRAAGGQVTREAEDSQFGRVAQVRDPWGAQFTVIAPVERPATEVG